MSKPCTWIARYIVLAILTVLLAGPLLNSLASILSVSIPDLQFSGSHVIRLGADILALAILCILAFAAFHQIPDNGRRSRSLHDLTRTKLCTRTADRSPHGVGHSFNSCLALEELLTYSLTTFEGYVALCENCATNDSRV